MNIVKCQMLLRRDIMGMYVFLLVLGLAKCTVDVNLSQLTYLSNHLQAEECRRLVASLHYTSYNKPNALDDAERRIPENMDCLGLLLHWNGALGEGEGAGSTHEALCHRLRQLGRRDLADWLGRTVYHQLGHQLLRDLQQPFPDLQDNTPEDNADYIDVESERIEGGSSWNSVDTICWVTIVLLAAATFVIIAALIWRRCRALRKNRHRDKKQQQQQRPYYTELEHFLTDTESEESLELRSESSASYRHS